MEIKKEKKAPTDPTLPIYLTVVSAGLFKINFFHYFGFVYLFIIF